MTLTLFRGGRVFDGVGTETREGLEVLVEDDRIKEVSDRPIQASDARVIELAGRCLMPGLIDAHFLAVAADPDLGRIDAMPKSLLYQHARPRGLPVLPGQFDHDPGRRWGCGGARSRAR
jgi:imidazolonepropionase-like amidohydrolase